jgi:hypothetical protein
MAELLGFSNRGEWIRMYNTLNWPSYNTETLGFLNNNSNVQVVIVTDTLSVGINGPAQTVVIFRRPQTPEEKVQKIGCIQKPEGQARGIVYLPHGSVKAAQAVVDADSKGQLRQMESPIVQPNSAFVPKEKKKKKEKPMDLGIAKVIVVNCIYSQLNEEFGNCG